MRGCVTCTYWTLLLISVVSSTLLFLIVASEDVQEKRHLLPFDKNNTFEVYDNVTLDNIKNDNLDSSGVTITNAQNPLPLKISYKDHYYQPEFTTVSASFENIIAEDRKDENTFDNTDVLAESTQQPNLSQGISESGQAVVLTLVDTAAAELQSLAEPKINPDFSRAKAIPKNASLITNDLNIEHQAEEDSQDATLSTQIPSPPTADEVTERLNVTDTSAEEVLLMQKSIVEDSPEVVVVVRAEQNPITSDGPELRLEDEVGRVLSDEIPKVEDFTAVPELNDTAARAQLVAGTRDESAAVILGDGIAAAGPTDPHEDIPSFSEWAQKRLEEAEKKKTHPNASIQNSSGPNRGLGGMKVRSKNYASPDCGAKVVAANPEARSARSVLASTRDEYMLNTCTSRIWFVVELCEAIQAKKIELANFELFSSSPKDFSTYISDRFPTRDWSPVGQFTAKDTKDIQSFALHPHLFGKFIKVELHTYYGSEHFCPISLFRAYGTSEFEVLETETENQVSRESPPDADDEEDSDEEEPLDAESGEPPRNLFGSARDAVLSIVKKAAEVLVKSSDLSGNNITQIQENIDSGDILESSYTTCTTPRYTILCGNCSDQKFAKVFQLVSCREQQLDQLLRIDVVNKTLRRPGVCSTHGVEIERFAVKDDKEETEEIDELEKERDKDSTKFDLVKNRQLTFLTSVFNPDYIVALCNVLATKERKVVMNSSYEILNASENFTKEDVSSSKAGYQSNDASEPLQHVTATCTSKESRQQTEDLVSDETEEIIGARIETASSFENLASQIKPTKTLGKEDMKKESSMPILEPSKESTEETVQTEMLTTIPPSTNVVTHPSLKIPEEPLVLGTSIEATSQTITSVPGSTIDSQQPSNDNLVLDTVPIEVGSVPNKIEKSEQLDQEGKQGKLDLGEQEMKLSAQDPLTFDTLLSDLKDFENEAAGLQNGPAVSSSSMAQPTTSSTPQKESVFLRLSNRIKALERNMSLSGQYLEELSRRYKKQVEEMQRSLERAVSAMSEESRRGEEREAKRLEEIAALRKEITVLSKSVESLLYDRDSWRSKFTSIGQHALLICLEVLVVILIFSYCRRKFEKQDQQQSTGKKEAMRRKSAENFGTHTKKTKKRRPSEIASHITGTYRDLLIEDMSQESKKERKRKRKKEANIVSHKTGVDSDTKGHLAAIRYKSVPNVTPGTTILLTRRALSVGAPEITDLPNRVYRTQYSVPETTIGWLDDEVRKKERVVQLPEDKDFEIESERSSVFSSSRIDDLSESNSSSVNMEIIRETISNERNVLESSKDTSNERSRGGILKNARLSSPSSFMKTALGSRKKRKLVSNEEKCSQSTTNFSDKSPQTASATLEIFSKTNSGVNGSSATNGDLLDDSDESRSSSATPTSGKKEKKSTGLKKMVRKLF